MSKQSIIIAGDCCLRRRTANLSADELASIFGDVRPIIKSADAALINLETSVIESNLKPIQKAGPALKTDARILDMIREIGFSGVTLANNHFADYGQQGVEESLRLLDEYKLWHVGAGLNATEAAEVGFLQVEDKKIAIINACEHEFTVATETKAGCHALDPLRIAMQITKVKLKSDYVVAIVHGGHEYYNLPSPRMQEMYRAFIDFGADAVVNHHQHCYSGYELYNGKPIVYGLGNFFFDGHEQKLAWNEGYMVKLELDKKIGLELIPYIQNAEEIGVRLMNDMEKEGFEKKIKELNSIITDPIQLQQHMKEWAETRKDVYMWMITPRIGKRISQLEKIHWITEFNREKWNPEYLTEERRLLLQSLFQCESHQEIMNLILL